MRRRLLRGWYFKRFVAYPTTAFFLRRHEFVGPFLYPHILAWINGLSARITIILFTCRRFSVVLGEALAKSLETNSVQWLCRYILYIRVIYTVTPLWVHASRVWSSINRSPLLRGKSCRRKRRCKICEKRVRRVESRWSRANVGFLTAVAVADAARNGYHRPPRPPLI